MILADPPLNGIFQAQSGSGKTVAFSLGMLARCDPQLNESQALCVSHVRELGQQTYEVVEKIGKHTGLRMRRAMKGYEVEKGTKITEQIIIGTPGRVETWLKKKFLSPKHFKVSQSADSYSAPSCDDVDFLGVEDLRARRGR